MKNKENILKALKDIEKSLLKKLFNKYLIIDNDIENLANAITCDNDENILLCLNDYSNSLADFEQKREMEKQKAEKAFDINVQVKKYTTQKKLEKIIKK